jgi:DUF4097 and DUF4098 domain-containing protein YvlB
MNEERRRILQMVADGKLTSEEAAELLDALQAETRRGDAEQSQSVQRIGDGPWRPTRETRSPRTLMIQISEGDDSHVNLRIPFGLFRAAGKYIPRKAQSSLREYGIDLEELLGDLSGSESGVLLQVNDGDDHVLIAVE